MMFNWLLGAFGDNVEFVFDAGCRWTHLIVGYRAVRSQGHVLCLLLFSDVSQINHSANMVQYINPFLK